MGGGRFITRGLACLPPLSPSLPLELQSGPTAPASSPSRYWKRGPLLWRHYRGQGPGDPPTHQGLVTRAHPWSPWRHRLDSVPTPNLGRPLGEESGASEAVHACSQAGAPGSGCCGRGPYGPAGRLHWAPGGGGEGCRRALGLQGEVLKLPLDHVCVCVGGSACGPSVPHWRPWSEGQGRGGRDLLTSCDSGCVAPPGAGRQPPVVEASQPQRPGRLRAPQHPGRDPAGRRGRPPGAGDGGRAAWLRVSALWWL